MARFDDTPAWKRRLVWCPAAGRMVEPATDDQLLLIFKLSAELGREPLEPVGKADASKTLRGLIKDAERRRARFKEAA